MERKVLRQKKRHQPNLKQTFEHRAIVQDVHHVNVQMANGTCSLAERSLAEPEGRTESESASKNISEARTEGVSCAQTSALSASSSAPLPVPAGQRVIQFGERRNRSADKAVGCDTDNKAVIGPHASCSQSEKAGNVGCKQKESTPALSTTSATFPHELGKTASHQSAPKARGLAFQATLEAALSQEARVIYAAWCSLFTVSMPLTPATAKAAESLVTPLASWCSALNKTTAELLGEIMGWLYATDRTGYYQRGVKLYDISREFEGWQSAREREARKKTVRTHVPTRKEDPYSIAALLAEQNPGFFA